MTCTSPSSASPHPTARGSAPRAHRRAGICLGAVLGSLLLAGATDPAPAGAESNPLRQDEGSLLGAVDSSYASIVTVVGYLPAPADRPAAKRHRIIGTAIATGGNRVLTPASLALRGGEVYLLPGGGVQRRATLKGVDRDSNVALFEVDGATLRALRPAPPQSLAIGAWVAVISNVAITRPQAALGRIVGRGERLDTPYPGEILEIDAPSYLGATGAAVLNEEGEWVAVVIGRAVRAPNAPGSRVDQLEGEEAPPDPSSRLIAIPVSQVQRIVSDLDQFGHIERAFLGIKMRRTPAVYPQSLGVLVSDVLDGSPAHASGIRSGDRILAIGGREVQSSDEITQAIQALRPGQEISITLFRDDEIIPLEVVLGTFADSLREGLGATGAELDKRRRELERLKRETERLEAELRALERRR